MLVYLVYSYNLIKKSLIKINPHMVEASKSRNEKSGITMT